MLKHRDDGSVVVIGAARLRAQALETCFVRLSLFSVTDVGDIHGL